jgi:hypothetical protein
VVDIPVAGAKDAVVAAETVAELVEHTSVGVEVGLDAVAHALRALPEDVLAACSFGNAEVLGVAVDDA